MLCVSLTNQYVCGHPLRAQDDLQHYKMLNRIAQNKDATCKLGLMMKNQISKSDDLFMRLCFDTYYFFSGYIDHWSIT